MVTICTEPLTPKAFAPFGQVLAADGAPDRIINRGLCGRWHDRASLDVGPGGRAGISVFLAQPRALPCDLMERHPEGSQAVLPLRDHPALATVAPDAGGAPFIWPEIPHGGLPIDSPSVQEPIGTGV